MSTTAEKVRGLANAIDLAEARSFFKHNLAIAQREVEVLDGLMSRVGDAEEGDDAARKLVAFAYDAAQHHRFIDWTVIEEKIERNRVALQQRELF